MSKVWHDGNWYFEPSMMEIVHIRAGYHEEGTLNDPDIDITIPNNADLGGLIRLLEERGYIKPRLDERLRAEDLKITHRLIDTLQQALPRIITVP